MGLLLYAFEFGSNCIGNLWNNSNCFNISILITTVESSFFLLFGGDGVCVWGGCFVENSFDIYSLVTTSVALHFNDNSITLFKVSNKC